MANIIEQVKPGDVISSDLVNRIIALVNEHEARLAGTGGSGESTANLISGFSPAAQQNVGNTLTVFGNFDFPLAGNTLSIDGVPIAATAFLAGSNNLQILFKVPATIAVAAGASKTVLVRVSNSRGRDQASYALAPAVPGLPDPAVNTVTDFATSSTTLRSGQSARITGLNFLSPATGNRVVLVLNPGPNQRTFPPAQGASLTVDPNQSNIQQAPQVSTLAVAMPGFVDADGIAVGDSAPALIQLTVAGANNPASVNVAIERTV
jgi:hypothetical protein